MNRSAKGLLIVTTILDGFGLANRRQFAKFAKFAKLSTSQTFPLYGILNKVASLVTTFKTTSCSW